MHTLSLLSTSLFLLLTCLPTITAQHTCNTTTLCPESVPCCSEYGFCGTGTYCLGGCEPLYSFQLTSCLPNPICENATSTFTDLSRVQLNGSLYDGNAMEYDWMVNSGMVTMGNDGLRLTLNETNGGTKISSTRYVHYGTIDFVLETSKWNGVVTAAITMSDVKDEIDWEFPGSTTSAGQTNFWYLGIADYSQTQGKTVNVSTDTSSNFHTYSLDWQKDHLNWLVDGNVVRTVQKSDTYGEDGTAHYPMTPSRVQISIWPAGINTSAQGTIDWAGGMIDWQDPDFVNNGYFWNTIQSVKISCAADANKSDDTTGWAYTTTNGSGVPQVLDTNASTVSAENRSLAGPSRSVLGAMVVMLCMVMGLGVFVL